MFVQQSESQPLLFLLLLSVDSSGFFLDSLLHLRTRLFLLLSSSCGFLTLSTNASQSLQGRLRFRLRIRGRFRPNSLSFQSLLEILLLLSLELKLAPRLNRGNHSVLLLSRDFDLQLTIAIHRRLSLSITLKQRSHASAVQISIFKHGGHRLALLKDLHSTKTRTSTGCFGSSFTGGLWKGSSADSLASDESEGSSSYSSSESSSLFFLESASSYN